MVITLNAVNFDDLRLLTIPTSLDIEAENIKYVTNHKKANQYDTAMSDVTYYDEQAATLMTIGVEETPHAIYVLYNGFVLVTVERTDATTTSQPRLLNESSYGYVVGLSPKDPLALALITYSSLAGGTFNPGDIITGDVTFATAQVIFDDGAGFMVVHPLKRVLSTADAISNAATPQVSADVDTYAAAVQKFHQYQEGFSSSARKKDLVVRENDLSVDYAVTAVDIPNNSVTIAGDHQEEFTKDVPVFWNASTANDGMYSVHSSLTSGGNTVIRFMQRIPNYIADGTIKTT